METLAFVWTLVNWSIRIVMLAVVPHRRPPAHARAWLFFIFLLPVPGLLAYHVFGRVYQPRRLSIMRKRITKQLMRANKQWSGRSDPGEKPKVAPCLASIPTLVERLGGFAPMDCAEIEVMDTHPQAEDALVRDIENARRHVHLLYYTFEDDNSGRRVAGALAAAARRGVTCRLLLDAVGAAPGLRHLAPDLRTAGVEIVTMLPVGYFRKKAARFDLRNHRKLAIVDGDIGHIGSANVVDPPSRDNHRCQEIVLRVRGRVVSQMQVVFLSDRYLEMEEKIEEPDLFPADLDGGDISAQILPSGPGYDFSNTRKLLTSLFHNAREKVVITTPYFIPDASYINAMQCAALRGVQLSLIVPLVSDSLVTTYAQESFFSQLLSAGIRVFCYKPALLHSKMITVDDEVAVVGSANMDIRSMELNREVSLVVYDKDLVARLRDTEQRYIDHGMEITASDWAERPTHRRLLQNFARLFDSFL